ADLRKWGCIPQWKRELIEKRHHGKNVSEQHVPLTIPETVVTLDHTIIYFLVFSLEIHSMFEDSGTANGSHPDSTHSLISAELTEKLQRRLEKVAAMAES
ncbi:hypothetical protein FBUS_03254, partial [Fasciolopsis buskii]